MLEAVSIWKEESSRVKGFKVDENFSTALGFWWTNILRAIEGWQRFEKCQAKYSSYTRTFSADYKSKMIELLNGWKNNRRVVL